MSDELITGLAFLLLGFAMTYFGFKKIRKYGKEKYDPFKDRSQGITRLLNVEVFYKSYGVFLVGICCILISLVFFLFLLEQMFS